MPKMDGLTVLKTIRKHGNSVPVLLLTAKAEIDDRMDASHNSKTGGFGIGLSVVGAIVTAHKGKITAKSEDGRSIVFTVVL